MIKIVDGSVESQSVDVYTSASTNRYKQRRGTRKMPYDDDAIRERHARDRQAFMNNYAKGFFKHSKQGTLNH